MALETQTDSSAYAESSTAPTDTPVENSTSDTVKQVKQVTAQVVDKLGDLDKYFGEFYQEY